MNNPLEHWYCDVCGNVIEKASDGYVIWRTNDDHKSFDFKIIHQGKCDLKSYTSSAALEDFLGINGLVRLTSFLSLGPLKQALGQATHNDIINTDEFIDFVRRVQIPYYEEARRKFAMHDVLEWHSDSNEVAPYFPGALQEIIKMKIG